MTIATPRQPLTDTVPGGEILPRSPADATRPGRRARVVSYTFLTVTATLWLLPLLWAVYTSLRPESATEKYGYLSVGGPLNLENYGAAWRQGGFSKYFVNSAIITIPAVLITIALSSMVAFALSRVRWRYNIPLLILFTAGNLLPQQILAAPLFELYKHATLPLSVSDSGSLLNTYYGVIAVNVAFQIGFCTFVLSNYMKALPYELTEAAMVDGASVFRQYRTIVLPLCRPALAALGTLEFTFMYNDFLWALALMSTGDKLPVTSALNNLRGQFFVDYNLLAAGSVLVALPTLIIFQAVQKQFVSGLTLGATKG
jgi:multiple sugar transport system permease protein